MSLFRQNRQLFFAVASLFVLAIVDYHFAQIELAPIAAIQLLLIAYYGGVWPALLSAVLVAVLFGYIDHTPIAGDRIGAYSFPVDSAVMAVTFCTIVLVAGRLRQEDRRRIELQGALAIARRSELTAHLMALTDKLTGLMNRRGFDLELATITSERRASSSGIGVIFLDVDDFKSINDTYGHKVGDAVLKTSAGRIAESVRSDDMVARIGGDEFVILCHGTASQEMPTQQIADKISLAFASPMSVGQLSLDVSLSIGIAYAPKDGTEVDVLLEIADKRMYDAKSARKNSLDR